MKTYDLLIGAQILLFNFGSLSMQAKVNPLLFIYITIQFLFSCDSYKHDCLHAEDISQQLFLFPFLKCWE